MLVRNLGKYLKVKRGLEESDYMIYELKDTSKAEHLFDGIEDTLIRTCLQGMMNRQHGPEAFQEDRHKDRYSGNPLP